MGLSNTTEGVFQERDCKASFGPCQKRAMGARGSREVRASGEIRGTGLEREQESVSSLTSPL